MSAASLQPGEWLLHNVCLAFVDTSSASERTSAYSRHWFYKLLLFRAGTKLSLKSWPPLFHEGQGMIGGQSDVKHNSRRARAQREKAALEAESWPRQWHDESITAFVTALTMDNLWHSVYHAIPVSEFASRLASSHAIQPAEDVDLWPWFTTYPAWSPDVTKWAGWQMLARSLLGMEHSILGSKSWLDVAKRTSSLHAPGKVHCYRKVYGGHSKFYPRVSVQLIDDSSTARRGREAYRWVTDELRLARPRFTTFRQRVLLGFGLLTTQKQSKPRMLFVVRLSARAQPHDVVDQSTSDSRRLQESSSKASNLTRSITNEADLRSAVSSHPLLHKLVKFISFDDLPLHDQLRLISTSDALIGVHGQALMHSIFLRHRQQQGIMIASSTTAAAAAPSPALLEIVPTPSLGLSGAHSVLAYWRLAVSASSDLLSSRGEWSSECKGKHFRLCGNVTVGLKAIAKQPPHWWSVHDSLIVDMERVANHLMMNAEAAARGTAVDEPPARVAKRNASVYVVGGTGSACVGCGFQRRVIEDAPPTFVSRRNESEYVRDVDMTA